ncbi:PE family protein, partial [Mycobacterium intermedium]
MSFVGVVPEAVAAAAANLAGVGSALSAANAAAVVPTTQVLVAA